MEASGGDLQLPDPTVPRRSERHDGGPVRPFRHPGDGDRRQRRRLRAGERSEDRLQRAVDAAALTLVRDAASLDEPKLKERGRTLVRGLLKDLHGFSTDTITVSRNAKTIRVAASGTMKTAFMAVAGFDGIAIGSEAESTWGSTRIELALVLDNTGSMNEAPGGKG